MRIEDASTLLEVFCVVVEKQSFLLANPSPIPAPKAPDLSPIASAEISFSGHCSGAISVAMPDPLCKALMENALGMMDCLDFTREEKDDALAELINVLCGQFLTSVEGDKPVFNLSIPSIKPISSFDWDMMLASPGCRAAVVEQTPVLLNLKI